MESTFDSAAGLLLRACRIFLANFPFLASVALIVMLPGKLLLQLICALLGIRSDGLLAYFLIDLSDLFLGALVAPATIYGLMAKFQTGKLPAVGECLRAGQKLWRRMLWNQFKVEITVGLWSLLLFVPGIVAMVRLSLTDPVAALETRHPDPLARSRELTEGHRRRIFLVLLPLGALGLAGSFLALKWVLWSGYSRWVMALSDSLYAVGAQLGTVAVLLVYLSLFRETDLVALAA